MALGALLDTLGALLDASRSNFRAAKAFTRAKMGLRWNQDGMTGGMRWHGLGSSELAQE